MAQVYGTFDPDAVDRSTARCANAYKVACLDDGVGVVRSLAWAAAFVALGLVLALGLWPGSSAWEAGPRYGMATLLLVTGITVAGFALVPWMLRRTTKASDYEGGCPVGATCACGHFNFKPRKACRQCGKATAYGTP